MVRSMTAKEVEQKDLKDFGPCLGPLFHALYNQVVRIHAKWIQFRKTYAKSEQQTQLLKDTAPFFFRVVRDVLIDDTLLHLARLTDPTKTGKSGNLTLLRLSDADIDSELIQQIHDHVEIVNLNSANLATRRRDESPLTLGVIDV